MSILGSDPHSLTSTFSFYEYRARAYNPVLGRFMSEDPKLFGAGDYNLFRYCHNDPMDLTDAMGTDPHALSGYVSTELLDFVTRGLGSTEAYARVMGVVQMAMSESYGAISIGSAGYALSSLGGLIMGYAGQGSNGHTDSRLQRIGQMIGQFKSSAGEIAKQQPQYGASAPKAAEALSKADEEGRIKPGQGKDFSGPSNPFITRPSKGGESTIYYNARSDLKYWTLPRIAHEGSHLLDRGQGSRFSRERAAYDLQYAVGAVVGPYSARLTDAEVSEIIHQNP